ncbi:MAG: transporter [Bacteroidia bacterium]|nr:transporter [Bacteroidia bacterium]MBT8311057.1 transporter [Bacteroidia bacterium]NND09890.1 transporter [Flavobacteriaceae bacterium]NNK27061.1 transporter [Flavobacteriaceae bacterium]NNL61310.1 transporter [Flavobacteriaceae bacterium]
MNTYKSLLFVFLLTILHGNCLAQYTEVINSNRPGVSRSAFSVGTNVVQFEAGPYILNEEHTPLRYEVSGFGIDYALRYGFLFEQLELNLEGTYQNDTFTDNRSAISQEDKRSNFKRNAIGVKYLVYDPYKNAGEEKPNLYSWRANRAFKWKSLIPAVAVYAGVNFDTKENPYTAPDVEGISPKVMIASQNNFASGWVMVINLVADRIGTDFPEYEYLVTITKSINQKLVVFGETQGIKSDFYADNLFRLGGAYLFGKDFQLDTALTFNAKDTPSVFSVNFGASYRLDFHEDKKPKNDMAKKQRKQAKTRKKN